MGTVIIPNPKYVLDIPYLNPEYLQIAKKSLFTMLITISKSNCGVPLHRF